MIYKVGGYEPGGGGYEIVPPMPPKAAGKKHTDCVSFPGASGDSIVHSSNSTHPPTHVSLLSFQRIGTAWSSL